MSPHCHCEELRSGDEATPALAPGASVSSNSFTPDYMGLLRPGFDALRLNQRARNDTESCSCFQVMQFSKQPLSQVIKMLLRQFTNACLQAFDQLFQ